jgi:hypothetical protein
VEKSNTLVSKGARIYNFMGVNIINGKFRENNTKLSLEIF